MPRLSTSASKEIRASFAPWFRSALKISSLTLGSLAYSTRPYGGADGTEISHSNLSKFHAGKSAPSLSTALRLIRTISERSEKVSMLTGLAASYPDALVRVVIGLDVIGLDAYWKIRTHEDQLKRQTDRTRLQHRIGLRGFRALPASGEKVKRPFKPPRRLMNWIDELTQHHDLLAIVLAYAFFSRPYGDYSATYMREALIQFSATRESLYWEALDRYSDFDGENDHFAGPELYRAERAMANYDIPYLDRLELASALFSRWIMGHAEEFVITVPLLDWVEADTVRENLGI